MKHAYDLDPQALIALVDKLQRILYADEGNQEWSPLPASTGEWTPQTFEDIARLMRDHGLEVTEAGPFTKSYLMKIEAAKMGMPVVDLPAAPPPGFEDFRGLPGRVAHGTSARLTKGDEPAT